MSNILHATIGGNKDKYGDRTPGIWFNPGTSSLHICSAVNGNVNYCYNSKAIPIGQPTNIVVQQVYRRTDGKLFFGYHYHYEIYINGVRKVDVVNTRPQVFHNVKYYASDPFYNAAVAIISKFKVDNYTYKFKKHYW